MDGEKLWVSCYDVVPRGSPPHGRGKAAGASVGRLAVGITPAWAGKSLSDSGSCCVSGDHPRMGGEKARDAPQRGQRKGSPPHGRGKEIPNHKKSETAGITPAWAGKSLPNTRGLRALRDHPRMGGEKRDKPCFVQGLHGSPPHGRGKAHPSGSSMACWWITPAWAGKRLQDCPAQSFAWDHPRMGGEKMEGVGKSILKQGSPPHGRGKGDTDCTTHHALRITPAWAGKRLVRISFGQL